MMLSLRKHGRKVFLRGRAGRGAGRLELALGTRNQEAATIWLGKIERALAEGARSDYWPELRAVLPEGTFRRLAAIVGWQEQPKPVAFTWANLEEKFGADAGRRIALGKMASSTWTRYRHTIELFGRFLAARGFSELAAVNRALVEDFKSWRLEESKKVKQARGGAGVVLDAAILHRVFAYAIECEMLERNPVRLEGRPGDDPGRGAEPYRAEELARMREAAGVDLLSFLLLRHTGFRGSDAAGLRWGEIDWNAREINRLTQKRRKRVVVPIHPELLFMLEAERERRNPGPDDRVLLMDSETGKSFTRPKLYNRILALGKRAGVPHAHPHRFRDTFAVDMLAKGASPYDVAKLLGDTVETVEKHYAPFVRELRERARRIMETGEGLEKIAAAGEAVGKSPGKIEQVQ